MILESAEVCAMTGGELFGSGAWQCGAVSTDTRNIAAGEVFVALRGANFVGEDFLATAKAKAAVAAIVQERREVDLPQVVVKNTHQALIALAQARRNRSGATFIALTGSNGKTSTKEMLAKIFAQAGETLATRGNLNNDIGVPLTLLRLSGKERFAVIEMGANHMGEIAQLATIAKPDIALITNVSAAHLEGFGSLENVAEAKSEIYRASPQAALVINADLPYAAAWQAEFAGRRIKTFSLTGKGDIIAPFVAADGSHFQLSVDGEVGEVHWALRGKHNVANALAACAAASLAGLGLAEMLAALNGLDLQQSRLSAFRVGKHLIYDDTYNANPASFQAGIEVIAQADNPLVIAGAMGELGVDSAALHQAVVAFAKAKGIARFWSLNAPAYGGENFTDLQALAEALQALLAQDAPLTVLVKGSRSAQMERLFAAAGLETFRKG